MWPWATWHYASAFAVVARDLPIHRSIIRVFTILWNPSGFDSGFVEFWIIFGI